MMNRIFLIVILAVTTSSLAFAQGTGSKSLTADGAKLAGEVERLRQETTAAFQNNDIAALDRLLADDLIGTNPFGAMYDKAGLIGQIKSGQIKYEALEIETTNTNHHRDVIVFSSIVKQRFRVNGQSVSEVNRTTAVAERRQGGWQYTAIHGSAIVAPRERAEEELKQVVEEIRQAIVKGDAAAWDRLVFDNWVMTYANGAVGQPKAAVTNAFKTGTLRFDVYDFEEVKVHPMGSTALTSVITISKGRNGQQGINDRTRTTSVWARSPEGKWRLAATQHTRIQQPNQ